MSNQLDEAFNWFVLILGVIAGALSQFPEIVPLREQQMGLKLLRLLIFPMVILAFLWLWSLLARRTETQVIVKSLSWIFASILFMTDLVLLLLTIYPVRIPGGPRAGPLDVAIQALVLSSPLYFSLLFCLFVIRPRMREIYKDAKFLYSLSQQALLYVAAVVLYLFALGVFEAIIFSGPGE